MNQIFLYRVHMLIFPAEISNSNSLKECLNLSNNETCMIRAMNAIFYQMEQEAYQSCIRLGEMLFENLQF